MRRLLLALALLVAASARAENQATLVADQVTVQSQSVLVATGHVEVFFNGQHLTASAVTYDQTTDRLSITGPIRIDDGTGNVVLADQADLSADLTEGVMTSARFMLQQKLQISASQIQRSGQGRYTAMRQVAASWRPTRSGLLALISAASPTARAGKSVALTVPYIASALTLKASRSLAAARPMMSAPR